MGTGPRIVLIRGTGMECISTDLGSELEITVVAEGPCHLVSGIKLSGSEIVLGSLLFVGLLVICSSAVPHPSQFLCNINNG
ncbi:hypothetical protein U0070_002936 [Myodes glareolus]|uniref:Uncharacterized protein n=1 Tax=Myodes glareolus TaxID=447135 RepID=A0AAW0HMY3_MYOGA